VVKTFFIVIKPVSTSICQKGDLGFFSHAWLKAWLEKADAFKERRGWLIYIGILRLVS